MASNRLRPNRSPTTPKLSSSKVTGTRKASETQVSWVEVVARSWLIEPLITAGMDRPIWATATAAAAASRVPPVSRLPPCVARGSLEVVAMNVKQTRSET